jgi:hypothetical protein
MLEVFGETLGTILLVLILGGMLYAFYWILKYMLDGVRKSDD